VNHNLKNAFPIHQVGKHLILKSDYNLCLMDGLKNLKWYDGLLSAVHTHSVFILEQRKSVRLSPLGNLFDSIKISEVTNTNNKPLEQKLYKRSCYNKIYFLKDL
jgi:hypothetical protein